MTSVAEAPNTAATEQSFRFISHFLIDPSPLNPRKHFDKEKLAELAASIGNGVGIIEPLVVRPKGDDRYELIAGERRWRAADLAGLKQVPAMVRNLTDSQVLEMMVIENNQREDVNPLEEADGFKRLLAGGYDVDHLAERIGRSRKYVYDRIKLLDLVPEAQQFVLDGLITAGHGILLARLTPEQQKFALDEDRGGVFVADWQRDPADDDDEEEGVEREGVPPPTPRSVRDFAQWIKRNVRFNPARAAEADPQEFGAIAAQVEQAAATPGRGKKLVHLTLERVAPSLDDGGERIYPSAAWKFADGRTHYDRHLYRAAVAATCDHSVLGVVVAGPEKYGQAFTVCVERGKCDVHWADEIKAKQQKATSGASSSPSAAASSAPRLNDENEKWRREQEELRAARERWLRLEEVLMDDAFAQAKGVKQLPPGVDGLLQQLDLWDVADVLRSRLGKAWVKTPAAAWVVTILGCSSHGSLEEFMALAKALGLNVKRLQALRDKHEPKPEPETTIAKKAPAKASGKKKR